MAKQQPIPDPAAQIDHQRALELAFADRLVRRDGFVVVPTTLFVPKIDVKMPSLPAVALYAEKDGTIVKLKEQDQAFSPLALRAYATVLVKENEADHLRRFAEKQILRDSDGLPKEARMEALRRAAMDTVEDLFLKPTAENIQKSTKVVGSFVYVLMKEPQAYMVLARLSSHDPYTLQHSVGTAVNSIILARRLGIKEESDLTEVGMGGLLHDIGKIKVDPDIINKKGPLDEREWSEMRNHAELGYEMVRDNPTLSERTKLAIYEHHEDKHGKGYPRGVKSSETGIYSRIVAIADVFNALTTDRTYSKARTPFDAFKLMTEKLSHKIDDELYKNLVVIYGGNFDTLA